MPIAECLPAYQYLLVLVPIRLYSRRNETSPECRSRGSVQRQQSIRLQTILRRRLEEGCEVRSRSGHYLSNYGPMIGSSSYHSHTLTPAGKAHPIDFGNCCNQTTTTLTTKNQHSWLPHACAPVPLLRPPRGARIFPPPLAVPPHIDLP